MDYATGNEEVAHEPWAILNFTVFNMTKTNKKTALTVSKKRDGDGVEIAGLETPKVEVFPPIMDEETVEAKQAFSDPAQYMPKTNELAEAVAELPEAKLEITQRWYGEEFLPAYLKARSKLRRLAGYT